VGFARSYGQNRNPLGAFNNSFRDG